LLLLKIQLIFLYVKLILLHCNLFPNIFSIIIIFLSFNFVLTMGLI